VCSEGGANFFSVCLERRRTRRKYLGREMCFISLSNILRNFFFHSNKHLAGDVTDARAHACGVLVIFIRLRPELGQSPVARQLVAGVPSWRSRVHRSSGHAGFIVFLI
jgi:hypothetical protein